MIIINAGIFFILFGIISVVYFSENRYFIYSRHHTTYHHGENIMKDNIPDNNFVGNNIFLQT